MKPFNNTKKTNWELNEKSASPIKKEALDSSMFVECSAFQRSAPRNNCYNRSHEEYCNQQHPLRFQVVEEPKYPLVHGVTSLSNIMILYLIKKVNNLDLLKNTLVFKGFFTAVFLFALAIPVFGAQAQMLFDPMPDWAFVREDGSGPQITNVQAVFTDTGTLQISWLTDIQTTSVVEYATRAQYLASMRSASYPFPSYKEDRIYATNHVVALPGLIPNNIYYYRIRSIDQNSAETNSPIKNISPSATYPPQSSVTVVSPAPGSVLGPQATFSWNAVQSAEEYMISLRSANSSNDIYSMSTGLNTYATISGIPTDGTTLYLRIKYKILGVWKYNDFTYKAFADRTLTLSAFSNSTYHVGDTVPIKWSSTGISSVIIDLYDYKGLTKVRNIATADADAGVYNWVVPSNIDFDFDTIYTIRITDANQATLYKKSGKIELLPAPFFTQIIRAITDFLNW